jgi:L-alanine-DL-glutamate epimerase-like enolase superfamily enzyme
LQQQEEILLNFNLDFLDSSVRLNEIAMANIPYKRRRVAGKNARLGVHGWGGEFPGVRIKAGNAEGFGWCILDRREAELMLGVPIRAMFRNDGMLRQEYRGLEFPLLDWLGNTLHKPVYEIVKKTEVPVPYSVPVYDTTIYFDELDIKNDKEAVNFILSEVSQGLEKGHKNFKIKIGRCAMWMPLKEGLRRDIDIVLETRKLVGNEARLMADANNGYNLNLTKEFLTAVKDINLYWLEEAFSEDDRYYGNLKSWMKEQNMEILIADGEGFANPMIVNWAKKGLVNILQYDLRSYGFFNWMELCDEIEPSGVLCAPHNYGGYYGNYAQAHFAAATNCFVMAEIDAADAEGIDASAYRIHEGRMEVPPEDGFGLKLDEKSFGNFCSKNGYCLSWRI